MYEIVWFRLLETLFGVTTLATSTVLAVFMGGLALGAGIASHRADRLRQPVRAYGAIEILLAAAALVIPWAIPLTPRAFAVVYDTLHPSFVVLTLLRALVAALVLLPPAALMGMTLPILSRAFARTEDAGRDVGLLYTINTAGALAGAAVGGFVLVPELGLRGAAFVAVGLNLLAGVPAYVLGGRAARARSGESTAKDAGAATPPAAASAAADRAADRADRAAPPPGAPAAAPPIPRRLAFLAGLSGLCALAYQVFWTRALLLSSGNTVYAFTVILVTVLAGITLGSAIATMLLGRIRRPLLALAATQIAVAFVVVVLTSFFDDLPGLFVSLSSRWGGSWSGFLATSFSLAGLGLLPATILLGMGLPLVLGAALGDERVLARDVGRLYSINTWAGIAGSVVAGFVLIPLAGVRVGLLAMAAVNGATGLVALFAEKSVPQQRAAVVGGGCAALFAFLVSLTPPWNADVMTSGLHTTGRTGDAGPGGEQLVYYREGIAATVSVKKRGRDLKLQVNGRTEATSIGDLKTNTLLGSLPFLVRPGAKSALVIGLGSGVTLAAASRHPVESIECVELCGEVVEASRFFTAAAGDATKDPRVRLRAEDGRNHLLLTRDRYDVIISQPSNLWAAGVGNLFTREFFALCAEHLADDGVLCQWIQGYSVSKSSLRSILLTLVEEFPSVDVWVGEWSDLLVTASKSGRPIDVAALERAFADPKVGESLRRAGVPDAATLLSHHRMDGDAVRLYARGARIHTDDNRLIEFGEPKSLADGSAESQSQDLLAWETDVRTRLTGAAGGGSDARGAGGFEGGGGAGQDGAGGFEGALANAIAARRLEIEARGKEAAGHGAEAVEMMRRAAALNPADLAIRRNLARLHVRTGVEFARRQDFASAFANFDEAVRADEESAEAAGKLGLLAMLGGADEEALRWTRRALELDPENETYFSQLADVHRRAGRWSDSRDAANEALRRRPDSVPALLLLAEALTFTNDPEGADRTLQEARRHGAPPEEMARIKKLVRQDG